MAKVNYGYISLLGTKEKKNNCIFIYRINENVKCFLRGLSFLILHTREKSEGIILNAAEC